MNVLTGKKTRPFRTVSFLPKTNQVALIEQRLLPHKFSIIRTTTYTETANAITDMVVRGAGAIGATAAYGYAQGLNEFKGNKKADFNRHEKRVFKALAEARPTAVDPVNALNLIRARLADLSSISEKQTVAIDLAEHFASSNISECQSIGSHGASLIKNGARVLTHCNAGWLAFVDYGSATAPMYAAQEQGTSFHVYCDETRPRSQGASLTAWELAQQGISHEVIADNAAGHLMQRGQIDLVIVGSDRTLGKTGEVANKIGTYTKAVLAKRHRIPFYVAIPFSTLDWETTSGIDIPIEDRGDEEVCGAWGITPAGKRTYVRIANPSCRALNPGFDVTPPELITGIITPIGIIKPKQLKKYRSRLTPEWEAPSNRD